MPALSSLTVSPASVKGGVSATATVTLTAPAPTGGIVVSLASNGSAASVPSTVTVPAGQTSAGFTITTQRVKKTTTVTLTAAYNSVTRNASLSVTK